MKQNALNKSSLLLKMQIENTQMLQAITRGIKTESHYNAKQKAWDQRARVDLIKLFWCKFTYSLFKAVSFRVTIIINAVIKWSVLQKSVAYICLKGFMRSTSSDLIKMGEEVQLLLGCFRGNVK